MSLTPEDAERLEAWAQNEIDEAEHAARDAAKSFEFDEDYREAVAAQQAFKQVLALLAAWREAEARRTSTVLQLSIESRRCAEAELQLVPLRASHERLVEALRRTSTVLQLSIESRRCAEAELQLVPLRASHERLVEALRPFAENAARWDGVLASETISHYRRDKITVGDLRCAREALAAAARPGRERPPRAAAGNEKET